MSRSKVTYVSWILLVLSPSILMGCGAETPTPSLVDPTEFVTYAHPTGVFTLDMPPDWIVNDTSDSYALSVEFSPPGSPDPLVGVYVVSLNVIDVVDADGDSSGVEAYVENYETTFYTLSEATFKEISRDPQPDGSLRIRAVVDTPQGAIQHNDFIHVIGPYFIALRTQIPDDPAPKRTLSRIINTLTVEQNAEWASAVEAAQGSTRQGVVGFSGLNAWVDRNSGFVVVGQIVNNGDYALEFVRIAAQLYDSDNNLLAEQDDFVSSDLVLPSEYTPFSIVFSDGLPPGTVRYELHASARYADYTMQTFYGPENFALTSEAEFDDNGFLVIRGQVRNEGTQTANLVKVIVTIFDEQQRVIATDTTLVEAQRVAPGETSPFVVRFAELGGVPNTFLVTVQGIVAD